MVHLNYLTTRGNIINLNVRLRKDAEMLLANAAMLLGKLKNPTINEAILLYTN